MRVPEGAAAPGGGGGGLGEPWVGAPESVSNDDEQRLTRRKEEWQRRCRIADCFRVAGAPLSACYAIPPNRFPF